MDKMFTCPLYSFLSPDQWQRDLQGLPAKELRGDDQGQGQGDRGNAGDPGDTLSPDPTSYSFCPACGRWARGEVTMPPVARWRCRSAASCENLLWLLKWYCLFKFSLVKTYHWNNIKALSIIKSLTQIRNLKISLLSIVTPRTFCSYILLTMQLLWMKNKCQLCQDLPQEVGDCSI